MIKNNKKIIGIVIAIIVIVGSIGLFKGKNNKVKKVSNENQQQKQKIDIPKEVSIRYAFADIDFDKIIQENDSKDDSTKADYIFIRFTGSIVPKTVKNSIMDIKNYKLDGKVIPNNSKVLIDKQVGETQLVIQLPNKTLKGKNAGHTLEINKDININDITKINGELKFDLPYSKKSNNTSIAKGEGKVSPKDSNSNNKNDKSNVNKQNTDSNKSGDNKKSSTNKNDSQIPKYTMELGKGIPFTTIILVRLDVADVTQYQVTVAGEKLDIKTDGKGKKVFIKGIKKDYSYDEVQERIKIEKIKK